MTRDFQQTLDEFALEYGEAITPSYEYQVDESQLPSWAYLVTLILSKFDCCRCGHVSTPEIL